VYSLPRRRMSSSRFRLTVGCGAVVGVGVVGQGVMVEAESARGKRKIRR
jgi:hypothetical protein